MPVSFVMYCDLEAMITKEVKVNRGKIQNKSAPVPIAVGAITVCRPRKKFGSLPMIYMGADCTEVLLQFIQSEVCWVTNILKNVFVPCIMKTNICINMPSTVLCVAKILVIFLI